ncbi:unnamed protein product, partial [Brenthis ino]
MPLAVLEPETANTASRIGRKKYKNNLEDSDDEDGIVESFHQKGDQDDEDDEDGEVEEVGPEIEESV